MATYSTTNIYAQINVITPTPCNDRDEAWDGPKWDTVCSNLNTGLKEVGQTWDDCCYIIKYYDRVVEGAGTSIYYSTNVTGIFYYGGDCELRDKDSVLIAFYRKLFKSKVIEDPDFFAQFNDPPYNIGASSNFGLYQYTSGSCSQVDENGDVLYDENGVAIPCDDGTYCCRRMIDIVLNNWYPSNVVYTDNQESSLIQHVFRKEIIDGRTYYRPCSSSCQRQCNNVMMEPLMMEYLCDIPCNMGPWSAEKTKSITVPGCEPCKIKIKYRTRKTDPCPELNMETFNDIYLDRIVVPADSSDPCFYCTLPDQAIHSVVMNYLINNEFSEVPIGTNNCQTNFRIIQAACWHDHYTEGVPGLWEPQRMIIRCGDDDCCVHKYKLCTDEEGNLMEPILLEKSSDSFQCHFYPYPCFFICDTE